jgi:hypothetical protein
MRLASAFAWIARVIGIVWVLFLLAFLIGEGVPPLSKMPVREVLFLAGIGCLFLGLILAWFREGWGGLLSVAGWVLISILAGRPAWTFFFAAPGLMGVIHLLCWWKLRGASPQLGGLRPLAQIAGAFVAVFLLLSANEIFGEPPLMASAEMGPADFAGSWSAHLTSVTRKPLPNELVVSLDIRRDGAIKGTVGDAVFTGHLESNRSWFGRMMHWRTDYLIRGELSNVVTSYGGIAGDKLIAPLTRRGDTLSGALFLSHPGTEMPLGIDLSRR